MKFKQISFIISFTIMLSCADSSAQKENSTIQNSVGNELTIAIDKKVNKMEKSKAKWVKRDQEIDNGGQAPLQVQGYFQGKEARILQTIATGQMGYVKTIFYLENNEIIKVIEDLGPSPASSPPFRIKQLQTYIHNNEMIKVFEKDGSFLQYDLIDLNNIVEKDNTARFIRPKIRHENLKKAMTKARDIVSF